MVQESEFCSPTATALPSSGRLESTLAEPCKGPPHMLAANRNQTSQQQRHTEHPLGIIL